MCTCGTSDYADLINDNEALQAESKSLKVRVLKYEEFLHAINYAVVACNQKRLTQLIDNAFNWSRAHRVGNGEYTDEEQQLIIDRAFARLTEDGNG